MNPFEYINELKQVIVSNANDSSNKNKKISYKEHCDSIIATLEVLETEMKNAEYNYQVSSIENKNVFTLDELTVLEKQLNDEVLIFQPVNINGDEVTNVDMNSLAQVLTNLRNDGKITQNILVLPQNVNVFKAVLKRPDNNSDDENVT